MAKPLYEAVKKQVFTWEPAEEKAFQELKQALKEAPALGLPDLTKDFQLYVHEKQQLALGVLTQKLGSWKRPVGYFSKQLDAEEGKLEHDCVEVIEQVYASRKDLKDEPLPDPDWELFTDGSSFVENGTRYAGYAVVTLQQIVEAKALPPGTSAQKAEIWALVRALILSQGKRVNIWTDSKYAFGVVHVHGALWKERGLLNSQGSSIKYREEILQLLEAIYKPTTVAIMHVKGHQNDSGKEFQGNQQADQVARHVAREVYVRKWSEELLKERWDRPHQVIMTTYTTVKVQGIDNWIHYTRVKKVPLKWTVESLSPTRLILRSQP
ncbi:uncharacterized protein [Pithys albifrons albifrons]|uniref:uncharacterized protein n=1 Tax=Pithys albifrons albifrons TaxID=3385563 RepID=UPI003A5CFA84